MTLSNKGALLLPSLDFSSFIWHSGELISQFAAYFLPCDAALSMVLPWLVVCLSFHLSVMLRYCHHIRWNTSKIILRLISLGSLLSSDLNIMDLLKREHPRICTELLKMVHGITISKAQYFLNFPQNPASCRLDAVLGCIMK